VKWSLAQFVRYYVGGTIACGLLAFGIAISGAGKTRPDSSTLALAAIVALAGVGLAILAFMAVPKEERSSRAWEPVVVMLVTAGASAILVPVLISSATASKRSSCLSKGKQIAISLLMYTEDYDNRYPASRSWRTVTAEYRGNGPELRCDESDSRSSYAMNRAMSAKAMEKVKNLNDTVLLFEADSADVNFSGGKEDFLARHGGMGTISYADGHSKLVKPTDSKLRWQP
jgi:prepilin-type processing-associated H-X9-DG protein